MPYDLHTHSLASDGTTTPAQVVQAAAAAGLDGLSLTDHDTGAGLAEAAAEAERLGVGFLPGVEVSTSLHGASVHLLAYGDVTGEAALGPVLAGTVGSRHDRLRRIVANVSRVVPALRWEDVLARVPAGVTPGRPHVADQLVAIGAVVTRDEAFVELLAEDGPHYVPYSAPDLEATVRQVVRVGGAAVIAHPGSRSAGQVLDDDAIARLAAAGLAGLEVDHRDHGEATRARLRGLAAELGLLVTGASDYHGAGKQNRIGENTTSDDVVERLRERAGVVAP